MRYLAPLFLFAACAYAKPQIKLAKVAPAVVKKYPDKIDPLAAEKALNAHLNNQRAQAMLQAAEANLALLRLDAQMAARAWEMKRQELIANYGIDPAREIEPGGSHEGWDEKTLLLRRARDRAAPLEIR